MRKNKDKGDFFIFYFWVYIPIGQTKMVIYFSFSFAKSNKTLAPQILDTRKAEYDFTIEKKRYQ